MNAPVDPTDGLPNPVHDPVSTELDVERVYLLREEVRSLVRLFSGRALRWRSRIVSGPDQDSRQRGTELLSFTATASPRQLELLRDGLRLWSRRLQVTIPRTVDLLHIAERHRRQTQSGGDAGA